MVGIFVLTTVIFDILQVYLGQHLGLNNLWLIHVYTMLELSFFTLIYRDIIGKRVAIGVLIGFNLLALGGILLYSNLDQFNPWMSALEALLVILYILFYFYQTAQEVKVIDITRTPIFWLSAGALIYFSSSLFLFIFSNYIAPEVKMSLIFWGIHAMFSILLYIFFFITLWIKPSTSS